jgi:hypothetical protein
MVHNDRLWPPDTYLLQPMLEKQIGVAINVLRYVAWHREQESSLSYLILLLEPRDEVMRPDVLWQPLEKILESSEMPAALREGLLSWQRELNSGHVPELRAPWALPGWYAQAESWTADQVSRLGHSAILDIQPVKSWSISCVLKVITEDGSLYFKVARDLPLFVNEGVVLTQLADLYPGRVPRPIAVEPENGWFLLDDFGEAPDGDAPLAEQVRLMQDFACLQIDSSQKVEVLLAAGCKDRRLEVLLSQIHPLLCDEVALGPLTSEERIKLQNFAPRLRELVTELISLPIPYAILHGDLHAGNVIPYQDSFLYFDWTDAAISHPFFDMIHIFRQDDESEKTSLQDAYLTAWEECYPRTDVRRAWKLASVLYGFYHAVSYQYIARGIEELVRPELNFAFFFLRKLLAGLQGWDEIKHS